MATKTFEELKQLAIQIRDEKTNKQNTATRVGTAMLEHINKLEQDYYDKTTINNRTSEYNVSINHPTSGISSSNKYDLSSAIAQVPAELRTDGVTVSFLNSDGDTEKWEFGGGSWTVSGFSQVGDGKIKELKGRINIIEGIAITGEKEYSHINVDINSDGGTVWYNNRAYPEVSNVSGIKINARNAGTIELGIFNKNEKTMNIVDYVDVKKGIGEYFFNQTHTVDISNECLYIQNASGYYILSQVSSDEYFPYISSGLIQNNVAKGDILIQLITIPNLKNEIQQIRHELDYVKNETEKIQVIEDDITDISYATNSGITESGKCGNFDIASKTILEGTNRFYKKISLLKSKTLGIDASNQ